VAAVAGVRHAGARPVGGHHVVEHRRDAHHHATEGREVVGRLGVDQHADVGIGQRVAAGLGVGRHVVHGQHAGHRLL
jgi:hypothetical protein